MFFSSEIDRRYYSDKEAQTACLIMWILNGIAMYNVANWS